MLFMDWRMKRVCRESKSAGSDSPSIRIPSSSKITAVLEELLLRTRRRFRSNFSVLSRDLMNWREAHSSSEEVFDKARDSSLGAWKAKAVPMGPFESAPLSVNHDMINTHFSM